MEESSSMGFVGPETKLRLLSNAWRAATVYDLGETCTAAAALQHFLPSFSSGLSGCISRPYAGATQVEVPAQ